MSLDGARGMLTLLRQLLVAPVRMLNNHRCLLLFSSRSSLLLDFGVGEEKSGDGKSIVSVRAQRMFLHNASNMEKKLPCNGETPSE